LARDVFCKFGKSDIAVGLTIVGGAAVGKADDKHGAITDNGILVPRHLLYQRLGALLPAGLTDIIEAHHE
jgi:hypothetical protein